MDEFHGPHPTQEPSEINIFVLLRAADQRAITHSYDNYLARI